MKKWVKQAESDKVRYQEEMKDYVPMEEPGGKRKKAKKDPSAPKRNMSAYFLFSIEARPKVKAQNPDAAFGDIARIISAQFKELSDKEKKKWEKKAAEDKDRYQREMADFNA
jgi:HMG (high mobility group) box